ncbi:MAG: helix-turn-helix domain-containing protein [Actinomycetota bacterium]
MRTAELLQEARRASRLSQKALAARAATSQAAVSRYESGRSSPAVATLERLLAACGMGLRLDVIDRPVAGRTGPIGLAIRARKRELRDALARYGARNPRVFGSVARGTDTDLSDLDLLVDLPRPSYVLLNQVRDAVRDAVGVEVDVSTEALLREDVRDRVIAEAVPL